MKSHWFDDQRGSVLLFTTAMLVLLLLIGGMAIDLFYHGSVRRELQRSMDAAALAGAGNLGFDDTVFPAARAASQNYAASNGFSHYDPTLGNISLDLNVANNAGGDIVLGIWQDGSFTPSLDGSQVNAVQCNYTTDIPTSFLGLLPGMDSLPVSASAIAVSNPPLTAADGTCVFPIALSDCVFEDAGGYSSQGCGQAATFITSSGKDPDEIAGTNTAAWANLCGTGTPSVPETTAAIEGAASGGCNVTCDTPDSGDTIGTNNGMQQSVFDLLEQKFIEQYNNSVNNNVTHTVTDSDANITYEGPGWKVFVPVIDTDCPPQAINGDHQINGWTEMIITQAINHGDCAVSNPIDTNSWPLCPPPLNPLGEEKEPNRRAVFGYYNCTLVDQVASRDPGPRSALGTRLRLVQ